jgi:hypothetical protein
MCLGAARALLGHADALGGLGLLDRAVSLGLGAGDARPGGRADSLDLGREGARADVAAR